VVSQPIEYATVPRRPTTERSAQICAGIVTNPAREVLHPEAELHNSTAAFTKIIVRRCVDFENGLAGVAVPSVDAAPSAP
jgi:hypothetical protein